MEELERLYDEVIKAGFKAFSVEYDEDENVWLVAFNIVEGSLVPIELQLYFDVPDKDDSIRLWWTQNTYYNLEPYYIQKYDAKAICKLFELFNTIEQYKENGKSDVVLSFIDTLMAETQKI